MLEKINSSFKLLFSTKAFRIVFIYLALSLLWIFSTDKLVFTFISDAETQNMVSSIKGWFFVIATTLLLYHLIRGALIEVTTAEQNLIESEIKFRSVFENSVDAICVSKEAIHVFVNHAYLALFGYSHIDELVGKPIIDLIAPSKREYILDIVKRRAKGEVVPSVYETVGLRKDGSEFEMDVNVSSYHLNFDNYTLVILRDITERKKADDAIRESERRYQTLANISPVGIFRTDAEGSTKYVNPRWCQITGMSEKEAMGYGWLNAVHVEDRERLSRGWKEVIHAHEISFTEYRIVRPDRSIVWVMGQAVPEKNFNDQIVGYVGTITDITERKKAEEEILRISEKRKELEFIVNKSQSVVFLWKAEENWPVEYVSENISQFGYTPEELLSGALPFAKMIYPEDVDRVTQEISHYSQSGINEFVQEYRIITKSGEVRWIDDQTFVRRDHNNKITHYQGIVFDITERKRAEESLQKSEARYRKLIETEPECVKILTEDNIVQDMNPAGLALIEADSLEQIVGKSIMGVIDPEYRIAITDLVQLVFRGGSGTLEFRITGLKGTKRWLETHAVPLSDERGNIHSLLSVTRDITERKLSELASKRAEEALRESEERLRLSTELANVAVWEFSFIENSMSRSKNHDQLYGLEWQSKWDINTFINATHPDDREYSNAIIQKSVAAGGPDQYQFDFRVIYPDHSIHYLAVIGHVTERNEEGLGLIVRGSLIDITERKKVEEKLNQNRIFIESIVNASTDIIYIYDIEEKKNIYINDGIQKNLGYTDKEIKEMGVKLLPSLMHPEDFNNYLQITYPKYFTVEDYELIIHEFRMRDRNGNWHWLYCKESIFLRNQDGTPKQIFGVTFDITERKRAEELIQKNEHVFRLFVEHSPASIAMFDCEMKYIVASRRYLIDYDLHVQNVIGRSHYEIFPEIPERWKEIHKRCLAGASEKADADPFLRTDGEIDWVRWEILPWFERPDKIGGIILFSEVITERKKAEEEVKKSREEYRALSAHLQKIREEERASIAREMHDELGQILTSLKMNIAFIRRELEESNTIEMKNKILNEFQLMNMTLDKAVSELRKLITQLRPELLDKLGLIAALEWYSEEYQKTTKINCVFTSETEELFLDHDKELAVFRIVQEAMTNAAKHSGAKSVQIFLSKKDEKFSIEINDNGNGILETELDGSTSFGLMGMRERASLIGGNLEIFGSPGKGTTVRLTIGI